MNEETKQQIATDIELAKSMATLQTSQEITALNARLLGYIEDIEQSEIEHEYKAKQLASKRKVLLEFFRLGKQRSTTLSILEHESK